MKLTDRQAEVLIELHSFDKCKYTCGQMARAMDVGGGDGSHHSQTLAQLVKKGLAKREQRKPDWFRGVRGAWFYEITEAGTVIAAEMVRK